jgi:hypothetical protein
MRRRMRLGGDRAGRRTAAAALVAREGQLVAAFVDRSPGQRFLVSRLR